MKTKQRLYEPHLAVKELSLLPGKEWSPGRAGWSLVLVSGGNGYCLQTRSRTELESGAVLQIAPQAQVVIRASQLGGMTLHIFNVIPARLTGLITLGEEDFLKLAAAERKHAIRMLLPDSPVALKMRALAAVRSLSGLLLRLKLLELFVEAFGGEFGPAAASPDTADATERLRALLQITPPGDLVEMNFNELARKTRCTSRHLTRIFHELVGMSFRDKRAEIRMARARDLLATGNTKVVEVALESGYNSLSLFNRVFARRFGTSPGRWRQKFSASGTAENGSTQKCAAVGGLPLLKKDLDFPRNGARPSSPMVERQGSRASFTGAMSG